MKIAIMQPYLFPYIGYFQLINAVDKFVFYDDVNFIKQGWIARNRILLNEKDFMFHINLNDVSSFKFINQITIKSTNKIDKTIHQAYRKAPFFNDVYPLLKKIILHDETNLTKYIINSFKILIEYLGLKNIDILVSSEIEKDCMLKGDEKVIDICKHLKGTNYINTIGGQHLYSKEKFANNDLILSFIKTKPIVYNQFKNEFVPWLSIIDVMMFNSPEKISQMLNNYDLI